MDAADARERRDDKGDALVARKVVTHDCVLTMQRIAMDDTLNRQFSALPHHLPFNAARSTCCS